MIPGLVAGAPKRVREMGVANFREENQDSGF